MSETVDLRARRKEAAKRPYLLIMIVLSVVTAGEIAFFTPVGDFVPEELQLWRVLARPVFVLVLLAFAAFKATLVASYYMHLKYESWWIRYIPLIPLIGIAAIFATFAVL